MLQISYEFRFNMPKNFETLYLDAELRRQRTAQDIIRITDIVININEALGQESSESEKLSSLQRIGQQCRLLSRKNYDLCDAHPEIPWNILILLNELETAPDDEEFQASLNQFRETITKPNGLSKELEKRLKAQIAVRTFLEKFVEAEYALFHFQLDLQDLYCALTKARLESNAKAQFRAVSEALSDSTASASSEQNSLASLHETSYQNYLTLATALSSSNHDVPNEFTKLLAMLVKNDIASLYQLFKEQAAKYTAIMTEEPSEKTRLQLTDRLDTMIEKLESCINKGVISIRKKMIEHDLSRYLDLACWKISKPSTSTAIAPGYGFLQMQFQEKNLLIIDDFSSRMKSINEQPRQNLLTRMAQLYCILAIGEAINELIKCVPNLRKDEKEYLRLFSECRSALVHAVDSPPLLQNLWTLVFDSSSTDDIDWILTFILSEIGEAQHFLKQRFSGAEALTDQEAKELTLSTRAIHFLTETLKERTTELTYPPLSRYLTSIDAMLDPFDQALKTNHEANIANEYAAMLMCVFIGEIGRSVTEQGYVYLRTAVRHPEWQECIITQLKNAADLRAIFCHNLAENYQSGRLMQQEFALTFIAEFINASKKTLLTFEEKTFSRQMARSPEHGSDVYKLHSLMHHSISKKKEFENVVRRISQTENSAQTSKVIDSACKSYHEKLLNDSTRESEKLTPCIGQHFSSRDIADESSHTNHTFLSSPNTTSTSFSPLNPNAGGMRQTTQEDSVIADNLATNIRSHFYEKFGSSANEMVQKSPLLNSPLFTRNEYNHNITEALGAFPDNKPRTCVRLFSSPERRPKTTEFSTPERQKKTRTEPVSTGRRCRPTKQLKEMASSIPEMLAFSRSDLNQNFPPQGNTLIAASFWKIESQRLLQQTESHLEQSKI